MPPEAGIRCLWPHHRRRAAQRARQALRRIEGPRAGAPLTQFEILVHPEYDTVSLSFDPRVLSIYVRQPGWIQANGKETGAMSTDQQRAIVKDAVSGGAYAYFNHEAKFGVEQRFNPGEFSALGLFWEPSRQQVNLEMTSKIVSLEKGQTAGYTYEVRYLKSPPKSRK